MKLENIPTNLLIGFLGSGKTTAIEHLLRHRPADERWAVLVNEFGKVGVDSVLLDADGVALVEVAGGCMCCVASQSMQVGLNRLLREAQPHRLLIEPTGLGHPAQMLETLSGPFYQGVLDLRATLCLVDARQLSDKRYTEHPNFRDQIHLADVLVANKTDLYAQQDFDAFAEYSRHLDPPKQRLAQVSFGRVQTEWLDLPRSASREAEFPEAHRFLREQVLARAELDSQTKETTGVSSGYFHGHGNGHGNGHGHELHSHEGGDLEPGWQCIEGVGDGYFSGGWVFSEAVVFELACLRTLIEGLDCERIKAVVCSTQGWMVLNQVDGVGEWSDLSGDAPAQGRLEMIDKEPQDWQSLGLHLRGCARSADR